MNVYFVRHGRSEMGDGIHQTTDTPLSDAGKLQAEEVAKRFGDVKIDLILTSTSARALMTGNEIKKVKDVPLVECDLLVERRMPDIFLGKSIDDPEITPIHNEMRKNFDNDSWRFADEENFHDLRKRVDQALNFIASQNKEEIVVVTHGYFLTFLVFEILLNKKGALNDLRQMQKSSSHQNTGITVCVYKKNKWKLLTWNDHTHIEE